MGFSIGRLIDQIARIIANPGSNLAGAMLLLAMAVLVLLILAIGALITILPGEDEESDEDAEETAEEAASVPDSPAAEPTPAPEESADGEAERVVTPPVARTWSAVLPIVLFAAAGLSAWYVTGTPSSCGSCHATAPSLKSWRGGDHAKVGCVRCHEDGGLGTVSAALDRGSDIYVSMLGKPELSGTHRPVPSYRCLRCHARITRETMTSRNVRVSHKEFLDRGYECRRCHGGVGHSRADSPERAVQMNDCVPCHDGKKAASSCATCHVGDPSTAVRVSRAVYSKAHITPPRGCRGCHSTKACDDCHGIEMPHPPGFETAKGHAKAAAFERKELCWRCHVKQDCRRCHRGDFGDHGADWKQRHPSGVPLDGRDTCACHSSPNFCGLCHQTGKR